MPVVSATFVSSEIVYHALAEQVSCMVQQRTLCGPFLGRPARAMFCCRREYTEHRRTRVHGTRINAPRNSRCVARHILRATSV
jgi:hypothetical protein